MKILFVEDELSKNIPRIIRLFSKYLSKKAVKELKNLESDKSGYGAEPGQIKEIVERTDLIEVEYRFPDALRKIIQHPEKYALFIIDRNLVEGEYNFDEVKKIDPDYDEKKYERYFEREGDYLLNKLVYDVDLLKKFYFLTAYSAEDEIRGADDIRHHVDMGKLNTENFIEKGKDEEKLKRIIENIEIIKLQNENKIYLDILRKNISDKASEKFLHVLAGKDSEKPEHIAENLGSLRNVLENILTVFGKKLRVPDSFWDRNNPNKISVRGIIGWIVGHDKEKRKFNYQLDSNSIVKNFLYDIQEIASDFGPHEKLVPKTSGYQATSNTVNALVYALKDIILWFGGVCDKELKRK
jgi:hypothetical protein